MASKDRTKAIGELALWIGMVGNYLKLKSHIIPKEPENLAAHLATPLWAPHLVQKEQKQANSSKAKETMGC